MARKRTARKSLSNKTGTIKPIKLGAFSEEAMKTYGSYVLMDRAVADVRDGLKPVQRRILWAMHELKLEKGYKKSAKIVGDTMGNYHPHGDSAIYQTMVNMVWDRYPLVEGHGNFGSPTDNAASMRYCVTGSTLVDTELGLVPIRDIVEGKLSPKKALSIGGRYSDITRAIHSGTQVTLRIRTRLGYEVEVTPNEPMLALRAGALTPEWVLAEDLLDSDHLCLSRGPGVFPDRLDLRVPIPEAKRLARTTKVEFPSSMSPELGTILGYLVSEGTINDTRIEFINSDPEVLDHFKICWDQVFSGATLHEFFHEKSGCTKLECHLLRVRSFFDYLGLGPSKSHTKVVPWSVFQAPRDVVVHFLRSYFEGDGSSTGVGGSTVVADSKSRNLLSGVSLLLLRFGLLSSIHDYTGRDIHRLTLSSEDAFLFHEKIGFFSERKRANVAACTTYSKRGRHVDKIPPGLGPRVLALLSSRRVRPGVYKSDTGELVRLSHQERIRLQRCKYTNRSRTQERLPLLARISASLSNKIGDLLNLPYIFDSIAFCSPAGDQEVYDLTVEGTHAYTGNGFVVHNTEAKLSKLAKALFDDIDVAELVSNYSDDRKEPLVLPSRLPLLLLNGSSGIGVGLRATLPPHNLRELIRCLVYFVKKEHPRLRSVVKHMPGPDYGHGVLLSSQEEVYNLYETGKGSLQFRCEYSFEKDGKTPVLVVTSLAPGFNMSSFLKKMRALQEESLIEFCSDASAAEGVRIYVGFKDAGVVRDRVIPELHTSQSYQFYVVKRQDDAGLSDETLFSGGLFRLFQEFVDFRRLVEESRLHREMKLAKARLLKARAILAAIEQLDTVYDVLKDKHADLAALRDAMSEALEITEAQAQVILDMQVHRLARMNRDAQRGKIKEILEVIEDIDTDLGDIDGVIVRHLKDLLQFSDERGTKLNVPSPKLTVKSITTWVMAQGSKLTRLASEPSRRNKFDYVASGTSFVTAVYENNNAEVLPTSYLTEHSGERSVVGLVGNAAQVLVALDNKGRVVVVKHPPGKKTNFNLMKEATGLVSAVGVPEGGYLGIATAKGVGRTVPFSELKGTRAFVKGFKIQVTDAVSRRVATQLFGLPPGAELYDKKGRCITCRSEFFDAKGAIFAIGNRNFVTVKDGKRNILDGDATVELLKRGALQQCWIMD